MLGAAVLLWVAGFDIIYACQDHGYDTRAKLRSVPARLGIPTSLKLAAACHAGMLGVLVALPFLCPSVPLGWLYGSGIAAVATLLIVEHRLVRPDDLTRVTVAFFHVNAVVSIGLFVIGSIDLLW
jgi:4-hydroxybenzoate polyprenyltransferase